MFPRLQVAWAICSQGLGLGIALMKILNIYIKSVHVRQHKDEPWTTDRWHRPWKRYGLLVMASHEGRNLVFVTSIKSSNWHQKQCFASVLHKSLIAADFFSHMFFWVSSAKRNPPSSLFVINIQIKPPLISHPVLESMLEYKANTWTTGQQEGVIMSKGLGPENPTLMRRREPEEGDCLSVRCKTAGRWRH